MKTDLLEKDMSQHHGHAFLIGNVDFSSVKNDLLSLIKKHYFKNSVSSCVDIIIINELELPSIKRQEIIDLREKLQIKSQFNKCKVYFIVNCEDLNPVAANSLLNILEEPAQDIYAFLITKNMNKVMGTIKSRCKNYFLSTEILNNIIDENNTYFTKSVELINILEKSFSVRELVKSDYLKNKEDLKEILQIMNEIYHQSLYNKLEIDIKFENKYLSIIHNISNINTVNELCQKILIVNDIINDLNYNLNVNLLTDKLIILIRKCKERI